MKLTKQGVRDLNDHGKPRHPLRLRPVRCDACGGKGKVLTYLNHYDVWGFYDVCTVCHGVGCTYAWRR